MPLNPLVLLTLALVITIGAQGAPLESGEPEFPYSFRSWSTPEGAPHSYVNEVVMSPDGYVWIETSYGFARFNGSRFLEVPLPEIRNAIYRNLTVDAAGRVWMHAQSEGFFVRHLNGRIEHASFIPYDRRLHFTEVEGRLYAWNCCTVMEIQYESARVDTLVHVPNEGVRRTFDRFIPLSNEAWLILSLEGLSRLSAQGAERIPIDPSNSSHVARDMVRLPSGEILVATSQAIMRYADGRLTPIPLQGVLPNTDFGRLHIGADGHLYAASSTGLYRFNQQEVRSQAERLIYHDGRSVLVMGNGQIWYGTKFNGLLLLTPRIFNTFPSFPVLSIEGMLVDREGHLWTSSTCRGIFRYAPSTGTFSRYLTSFENNNPCRWGLFQDAQGTIWSGSWGGGIARFNGRTFTTHPSTASGITLSFVQTSDGRLFAGTVHESVIELNPATGAELRRISPPEPDSSGIVRGLYVDRFGTLWVGTTHRIWRLTPNGEPETILVSGRKEGARTFFESADGHLWAGLIHRGIARLNPPGVRTYGRLEGLGNNTVSFIHPFRSSLLIGTNAGIVQVPYAGLASYVDGRTDRPNRRILGLAEGMPVAETNGGFSSALFARPDSSLLIATPAGVVEMRPTLLPNPPPNAQVVIEKAVADTVVLSSYSQTILPLGIRRIQIEYLALTYSPSGEDYYETWLEGVDSDWMPAGSRTDISYQNLAPGRYTFRVRAFTKQGDLLETQTPLVFIVTPYFHETPPFWIIVLVVALLGLFGFDRLQRHRLSERQRELEQLVALRTDELATRNVELAHAVEAKDRMLGVASHDIRSPLASIVSMTELLEHSDLDPESREYVEDIRSVANRTLRLVQDVLSMARLREVGLSGFERTAVNVEALVSATLKEHTFDLAQKQQNLDWHPEAFANAPCTVHGDPSLLQQVFTNLFSNAIKYSPAQSTLYVQMEVSPESVRVIVRDEGPGVDADKAELIFEPFAKGNAIPTAGEHSTGLGLAIVREIVTAHNGRVWCEPATPKGAQFIVELPVA